MEIEIEAVNPQLIIEFCKVEKDVLQKKLLKNNN
jgi:hypothetical protein